MGYKSNLRSFTREFKALAKRFPAEQVRLIQRKLALDIMRQAAFLTPVDTGRARGGWLVTVNEPTSAAPGPRSESISEAEADRELGDALRSAAEALRDLPDYAVVFVQNNVEYIVYLEEGTDRIRAYSMLATAIAGARQQIA